MTFNKSKNVDDVAHSSTKNVQICGMTMHAMHAVYYVKRAELS